MSRISTPNQPNIDNNQFAIKYPYAPPRPLPRKPPVSPNTKPKISEKRIKPVTDILMSQTRFSIFPFSSLNPIRIKTIGTKKEATPKPWLIKLLAMLAPNFPAQFSTLTFDNT